MHTFTKDRHKYRENIISNERKKERTKEGINT